LSLKARDAEKVMLKLQEIPVCENRSIMGVLNRSIMGVLYFIARTADLD